MTSFMPRSWKESAYTEPEIYCVPSQTHVGGISVIDAGGLRTPWVFPKRPDTKTNVESALPSAKGTIQPQEKDCPVSVTEEPYHSNSAPKSTSPSILNDLALHRAYKSVGMRPSDLRCFNCLEEKDHHHRRKWMACSDRCPACPPGKQHDGKFCPKLCLLRKKEDFWKERAYVKFKDGYKEPTSGVEGWVRVGLQERAYGDEERASWKGVSTMTSILPSSRVLDTSSTVSLSTPTPKSTPSTPPLSRSSSATSLASTEGPKTPGIPSKGFFESMERTHVAKFPRKSLGDSVIVKSSSSASQARPPQSREYHRLSEPTVTASSSKPSGSRPWVNPSRLSFRESFRRSRSRSPSPELSTTRTYRDRRDILPAVEGHKSPPRRKGHPSIAPIFSDPDFVAVIKSEVVKILSCSVPANATRQREPFDMISMAVLQAAQATLKNGVETRGYQPSPSMKRYLMDLNRDFPILISKHATYVNAQSPARGETRDGTDTYFGHAQTLSTSRWDTRNTVSELIWLNQHLIKGTQSSRRRAWDQRDHTLEQDDRGYQANALRRAYESRWKSAFKRTLLKDTRRFDWDKAQNKSVTLDYDDDPADRTATYTPRRPHRYHQNSKHRPPSRPMQRRHTKQPENQTETGRSDQENVVSRARPQAASPVRRRKPSEGDGVREDTKPASTSDSRDIFSALEAELEDESRGGGFRIAEECWEDLLRGDV